MVSRSFRLPRRRWLALAERPADHSRLSSTRILMQDRSEEHTSELQSPDHLVCRLLLEKKKTYFRSCNRLLARMCVLSVSGREGLKRTAFCAWLSFWVQAPAPCGWSDPSAIDLVALNNT